MRMIPGAAIALRATCNMIIQSQYPTEDPETHLTIPENLNCTDPDLIVIHTVVFVLLLAGTMLTYSWGHKLITGAQRAGDTCCECTWKNVSLGCFRALLVCAWLLLTEPTPLQCWVSFGVRSRRMVDTLQPILFAVIVVVAPAVAHYRFDVDTDFQEVPGFPPPPQDPAAAPLLPR